MNVQNDRYADAWCMAMVECEAKTLRAMRCVSKFFNRIVPNNPTLQVTLLTDRVIRHFRKGKNVKSASNRLELSEETSGELRRGVLKNFNDLKQCDPKLPFQEFGRFKRSAPIYVHQKYPTLVLKLLSVEEAKGRQQKSGEAATTVLEKNLYFIHIPKCSVIPINKTHSLFVQEKVESDLRYTIQEAVYWSVMEKWGESKEVKEVLRQCLEFICATNYSDVQMRNFPPFTLDGKRVFCIDFDPHFMREKSKDSGFMELFNYFPPHLNSILFYIRYSRVEEAIQEHTQKQKIWEMSCRMAKVYKERRITHSKGPICEGQKGTCEFLEIELENQFRFLRSAGVVEDAADLDQLHPVLGRRITSDTQRFSDKELDTLKELGVVLDWIKLDQYYVWV